MISGVASAQDQSNERVIRAVLGMVRGHGFEGIDAGHLSTATDMPLDDVVRMFPDTRAVQRTLLFWTHDKLMALLEHVEMCANDPLRSLERIFTAHLAFIAKHPAVPELLAALLQTKDQVLREQMLNMMRAYEADLSLLICSARADGLIRTGVSPKTIAAFFVTILQGLIFRRLMDRDWERLHVEAPDMFRLFLRSIQGTQRMNRFMRRAGC